MHVRLHAGIHAGPVQGSHQQHREDEPVVGIGEHQTHHAAVALDTAAAAALVSLLFFVVFRRPHDEGADGGGGEHQGSERVEWRAVTTQSVQTAAERRAQTQTGASHGLHRA